MNSKKYYPISEELLRVIDINIRINDMNFRDKFQWDINDPNNSPEEFAWNLCAEMGLNGQFAVRIAHDIREQIQYFQKQLVD